MVPWHATFSFPFHVQVMSGGGKASTPFVTSNFFPAGIPEEVVPSFCPFSFASYRFSYTRHLDYPNPSERCPRATSTLTDCPTSSDVLLEFSGCSFSDRVAEYKCLGSWPRSRPGRSQSSSSSSEVYVALMDVQTAEGRSGRPLYRCGVSPVFIQKRGF